MTTSPASLDTTPLTPDALRCEDLACPLGIDVLSPRLSWELPAPRRGARQTAYQVLVASDLALLQAGTGDLWDSGNVISAQSVQIGYAGTPLCSRQRCYWAVRVWDEHGQVSPYSEAACWEMGLLAEDDWQAQWIAPSSQHSGDASPKPSPLFRATLALDQPVVAARAYICGLGYHELYVNGQRVSDHVLDPTFTRYDVRSLYVTHDVSELFTQGENAVGVILGNGWYNCHTPEVWDFTAAPWRHHPKLLLQIHLLLADGSTRVVATDPSWKVSTGPIVFDGLRNGETYDARLEKPGWNKPAYDDAAWGPSMVVPGPGGKLSAQTIPCKVTDTIATAAINEVRPGVFVFDMGQNLTGWAQLQVNGPAGTEVTLRYAEKLTEDGDIDQSNIDVFIKGGDCQTDRYILKGEGVETWEPCFTYHGFRYVQVTGFPGTPTPEALRARVVRTAFPSVGEFTCSNEMLNAVQQCTRWAYIGNYVGIPTDCPHREKNGWTGDAQLAAETGLFNYAAAPAYRKWMNDFADIQRPNGQLPGIVPTGGWGFNWGSGPAWDSAYLNIPWNLYQYCGDSAILAEHYPGMKRYVDYMTRMATDHIVSFGLGDWCPPESEDGYGHACPISLSSTGYYFTSCRILAQIATMLGKAEDAAYYALLAKEIKVAFNQTFYDPATGKYVDGDQTSQACALYQGLVEPSEVEKVLARLVEAVKETDYHPTFGILGAKYVLNTLVDHGRADVAYALAAQTSYPSWGHWIAQGATTLWESWEGTTSRNHIMFGDISAWMFKTLAGIAPEQPGFRQISIHPHPVAGLTWAKGEHRSPHGLISSAWEIADGRFVLDLTIPANTTATVTLPTQDAAAVTEGNVPAADAEGVTLSGTEPAGTVFTVAAGSYRFVVERPVVIPAAG